MEPLTFPSPLSPEAVTALTRWNLTTSVGTRIRRTRERRSWDRDELAARMGIDPRAVARLEEGELQLTPALVRAAAHALRLREEFLYPRGRPDLFWGNFSTSAPSADTRLAAR